MLGFHRSPWDHRGAFVMCKCGHPLLFHRRYPYHWTRCAEKHRVFFGLFMKHCRCHGFEVA